MDIISDSIRMWILSGLSGFLLVVLWWSIRTWIQSVTTRLDKLIEQNEQYSTKLVEHEEEIGGLSKRIDVNDRRLDDHSKRIRVIENKQASCRNYTKG